MTQFKNGDHYTLLWWQYKNSKGFHKFLFLHLAPSAPPENVISTSQTDTSLSFKWLRVPCGQRGGSNSFDYELTDEKGERIQSGSTPHLSVTLTRLEPCTQYSFKVRAYNEAGFGVFSPLSNCTTDGGKTMVEITAKKLRHSFHLQYSSLFRTIIQIFWFFFLEYSSLVYKVCQSYKLKEQFHKGLV